MRKPVPITIQKRLASTQPNFLELIEDLKRAGICPADISRCANLHPSALRHALRKRTDNWVPRWDMGNAIVELHNLYCAQQAHQYQRSIDPYHSIRLVI